MTEDAQLDTQVALLNPVEYQVLERYRRIRHLLDECRAMGFDLETAINDGQADDNHVATTLVASALTMEQSVQPKPSPEEE